jgi:hypothetical protein
MPVMNIIYVCDDLCDLCKYLRLLEKIKKRRSQNCLALGEERFFNECQNYALGEEPFFNESQIFPNISLSAKSPSSTRVKYFALGEGVAPTPNGGAGHDGKRVFDESQGRLSAHIRRECRGKLSAKRPSPVELHREAFAERKRAFVERIPALSEDPESRSVINPTSDEATLGCCC